MTPWDDLPAVEQYYGRKATKVDHALFTMGIIMDDLTKGFARDATERRIISASKNEIAEIVDGLSKMLGEIEAADTCQVER